MKIFLYISHLISPLKDNFYISLQRIFIFHFLAENWKKSNIENEETKYRNNIKSKSTKNNNMEKPNKLRIYMKLSQFMYYIG